MDHTVGLHHVCDADTGFAALGIDHPQFAVVQFDIQRLALNGFQHNGATVLFGVGHQLCRCVSARHNMVGEDFSQVGLVFRLDQCVDGTCRQFGKGFVCRGEYGEGAFAVEGINQPGGLDCGNECCVVLRVDRVFYDGFTGVHRCASDHHGVGGNAERCGDGENCEAGSCSKFFVKSVHDVSPWLLCPPSEGIESTSQRSKWMHPVLK